MKINSYQQSKITIHFLSGILSKSNLLQFLKSSILSFSSNGILYGLGIDQKLRCWNLKNNVKVILKPQVPVKAFQINEDTQVIKVIGKDNLIYEYLLEEFTEICILEFKTIIFSQVNPQEQLFENKLIRSGTNLELINKKTTAKYTINEFLTKISCVALFNFGNQFIVGLNNGSIYIYDASKRILEKYGKPVCRKTFARFPNLLADCCSIKQSLLSTQQNDNLEKLFLEKGAIKID